MLHGVRLPVSFNRRSIGWCTIFHLFELTTRHDAADSSILWHIQHMPTVKAFKFQCHMYVSLYRHDKVRKLWHRKFTFVHPAHLHGIWVKFLYEGHQVKIKVTGAKKTWNVIPPPLCISDSITTTARTANAFIYWGVSHGDGKFHASSVPDYTNRKSPYGWVHK